MLVLFHLACFIQGMLTESSKCLGLCRSIYLCMNIYGSILYTYMCKFGHPDSPQGHQSLPFWQTNDNTSQFLSLIYIYNRGIREQNGRILYHFQFHICLGMQITLIGEYKFHITRPAGAYKSPLAIVKLESIASLASVFFLICIPVC